jgi:preprotein translocase subunit SecE
MATVGKQPATQTASPAKPAKPAGSGSGSGGKSTTGNNPPRWWDRQRENIRNVMAELRKVTWPTREETRNLTIVVLGISVVLGALLASVDAILTLLYHAIP